jgi:hypothetical protein
MEAGCDCIGEYAWGSQLTKYYKGFQTWRALVNTAIDPRVPYETLQRVSDLEGSCEYSNKPSGSDTKYYKGLRTWGVLVNTAINLRIPIRNITKDFGLGGFLRIQQ